jgi:pimeloyl-ACP methyl ester carboxylesterase
MMLDFAQASGLLVQESGAEGAPVLVYLPGLQGDWTLMWQIRPLLARTCRLIELAYPHASADWELDDYVARLLEVFDRLKLTSVHLLAESFASLPGILFCRAHPGRVKTLILAGGVASSPGWFKNVLMSLPLRLLPESFMNRFVSVRVDRTLDRMGFPPSAFTCLGEHFPAARTRRGRQATLQRMHLVRQADLRPQLPGLRLPVLYIGGESDSVVPVRREVETLKNLLPLKDAFRAVLYAGAPHPILPVRYQEVAELIEGWVREHESSPSTV